MKPHISAFNDWIKQLVVHPQFEYATFSKNAPNFCMIKWGAFQQYDYMNKCYCNSYVIELLLSVFKYSQDKIVHDVHFEIQKPSPYFHNHQSSGIEASFDNIKLKDIIEFKKISTELLRKQGEVYSLRHDTPFYITQQHYPQFVQIKDTLINYLTKCNIANSRKKELEKDFKYA